MNLSDNLLVPTSPGFQEEVKPEVIFELRNVSKRFDNTNVLDNINLRVRSGERVALVGKSGVGKTTLLHLLNGSIPPSQGEARIFGHVLTDISPQKARQIQQKIGTIYQQFHLVNHLRVIHNVNAGNLGRWSLLKAVSSLLRVRDVDQAARALSLVGIPEKLYERTGHLSGGQQQRVAVARVLTQDPLAILADEPIASVDMECGREIMDLLLELNLTKGKTLVVSLHMLEFAYSHCKRIIGLKRGRIIFDAPSDRVSPTMIAKLYEADAQ